MKRTDRGAEPARRRLTGLLATAMVGAALTVLVPEILPAPVSAEPTNPPARSWVTNGRVSSIVHRNGRIYLGGFFNQVGPSTGNGVGVDPSTGTWNQSFPYIDGPVYAAVSDGSGGWYVAGDFSNVGNSFRKNAARITATGIVTGWNPAVSGIVYALAVSPGQNRVFLGGDITAVGGVARTGLASVTADTGALDTTWAPTTNGTVRALTVGNGRVYASGTFTSVSGLVRNRLAAVDATTGSVVTTFTSGADAPIDSLVLSPAADILYAAGEFTTLAGTARSHLGALNATAGTLTTWNPGADGVVETLAMASTGSTIYAGGTFATAGGTARSNLVALSTTGGTATSWNPSVTGCFWAAPSDPPCVTAVHALALSGDGATLYAGGLFTSAGGASRSNAAALSTSTGVASAWNPNANAAVQSIVPGSNAIFLGGLVTSVNGVTRNRVAALDATTGTLITSFVVDADDWVEAIALSSDGSRLFLGGTFLNVNGVGRIHVASVDATTGALDTAWNPGARGGEVMALAVTGSRVFIGGKFTSLGSAADLKVGVADATTGAVDPNWHPNPDDWVAALAVAPGGSTIYVGGNFSTIGGKAQRKLAAVTNTTGVVTTWAPTATYPVLTILPSPDGLSVYSGGAGGRLTGNRASAYSATASGSPRWETTGGDGNVQALALSPDARVVFIGGHFATMDGAPRQHFLAVAAADNTLLPFAPTMNSPLGVWTLDMNGGTLYAGGDFTRVSGLPQQGFARFLGAGPALAITSGPASGSTINSGIPSYGGTAATTMANVARIEAQVDSGTSSTSGVACTGCGTTSASWTWTAPTALSNGAHTITFTAFDSYGDASTLSQTVTVDTGAPTIAVTGGPADGGTTSSPQPQYSGTATDGSAVASVQAGVDGGTPSSTGVTCTACNTASATWKFTPPAALPDGPHTFTFRAIDVTGIPSTTVSRTATVDAIRPTFDGLAAANNSAVATATFSELLSCTSVVKSDFSATVNGATRTITGVTCAAPTDATIDITLKTAVRTGDNLVVTLNGTVNDAVGNSALIPVTRSLLVGGANVAPTLAITAGPADGTSTTATRPGWSGSAADDGSVARVEVAIDGGAFATTGVTCTGCGTISATWTFTAPTGLGDGVHTFAFRSVDNAALVSASAGRSVRIDTTAPSAAIGSGPADAGLVATATPTYGGTAADNGSGVARVEASIDGGAFSATGVACTGCGTASAAWTFTPSTGLSEATHTLSFRSVDNVGLNSALSSRTVTVDVTAPALSSVAATGGNGQATLTFVEPVVCSSVAAADFSTTVAGLSDGVTAATCSGTSSTSIVLMLAAAPAGGAAVTVSVTGAVSDAAGNTGGGSSKSTIATNAAPVVGVTSGPADNSTVGSASPAYGGTAGDADGVVARVELAVDGAAWSTSGMTCSNCGAGTAGWSYAPAAPLTDGVHTLSFRSVDGAGATSLLATVHVTVDTGAPTLTVTTGPANGTLVTTAQPAYGGTAADGVAVSRVEVSVDGTAFTTAGVTCTSCGTSSATWAFTPPSALGDGSHTFAFRSVDNGGNLSAPASTGAVIDTTPPTLQSVTATGGIAVITAVFSEPINCSTVSRGKFSATVAGASRTINSTNCTGTSDPTIDLNMSGSIRGGDAVAVTVTGNLKDGAGLIAPLTSMSGNATNAAPAAAITTGPADGALTNASRPTWGGTASDGDGAVSSIQVSVDGGLFTSTGVVCTGCGTASATWTFTPSAALADGAHTVEFRSVDNATAVSTVAARSVSIDTDRPTLTQVDAAAGSTTATLTFDEAVLCSTVAAADFAATVNGGSVAVNGVTCSGTTSTTAVLTLARTLRGGDTVSVSLTATAGGISDPAGNATTNGTKSVTLGDTAPSLVVTSGLSDFSLTASRQPTFGGTASDSDGVVAAVEVDVDGTGFSAGGVSCTSCGTASVTWSYSPAAPLADGPHTLTFRSLDNAGVASTTDGRTITVDSNGPSLAFTSGPANAAIVATASPNYAGTAGDTTSTVAQVQVDVDSTGFSTAGLTCTNCGTASATWTWTPSAALSDGPHTLTFKATDAAGNLSTTISRTVTVDTNDPTLGFTSAPADNAVVATATPSYAGTATDSTTTVTGVKVDVDGNGYTTDGLTCTNCNTASATWTWTPTTALIDGLHVVTFEATDAAGNLTTTTRSVTVDTGNPAVAFTSGPDDTAIVAGGSPTYGGTATDTTTTVVAVKVDIDGAGYTTAGLTCTNCNTASATWTWTPTSPLNEGTYVISFQATDAAGHSSTTSRSITVDTTGPTVQFTSGPADNETVNTGSPTYGGSATDATTSVTQVQVDVDGAGYTTDGLTCTACGTASATWTWTPATTLSDGTHVITFEATDSAGNTSTASQNVTVQTS